ncbi:hypothetical protein L1987_33752 [Smallanthus sonchifolius]|uniref:Uncharacterized protein n=1 Tax=Smallanthus sonchifolius TaxID=185202 RepID=A0ACB9HTA5_9ASTR|nr:hypothetical protein L1987_33752 [Smallanthus sonchifolius]
MITTPLPPIHMHVFMTESSRVDKETANPPCTPEWKSKNFSGNCWENKEELICSNKCKAEGADTGICVGFTPTSCKCQKKC